MSMDACLIKHVPRAYWNEVKKYAEAYKARGMSEQDAQLAAANDMVKKFEAELNTVEKAVVAAFQESPMYEAPQAEEATSLAQWAKQKFGDAYRNFLNWFGDSKVVDANGMPLVLYHGAAGNRGIEVFTATGENGDALNDAANKGIHFSLGQNIPNTFAWAQKPEFGGAIYPVYLKIENLLTIEPGEKWGHGQAYIDNLKKAWRDPQYDGMRYRAIDNGLDSAGDPWAGDGYGSPGEWVYVVRKPEQIKSAVGNDGTFGKNDGNILRRDGAKTRTRVSVPQLEKWIAPVVKKWKNGIPVRVVADIKELAEKYGIKAPATTAGIYHKGAIYLVASNTTGYLDAMISLFHEAYGHYGLRGILPKGDGRYKTVMQQLFSRNEEVRVRSRQWLDANKDQIERLKKFHNFTDEDIRLLSVEEAVADMAYNSLRFEGLRRFVALITDALRAMGLHNLAARIDNLNDTDVMKVIAASRDFVMNGDQTTFTSLDEIPAYSSIAKAPVFYSNTRRFLENLSPKTGSMRPEEWVKFLQNNINKGVNTTELKDSGLLDWLNLYASGEANEAALRPFVVKKDEGKSLKLKDGVVVNRSYTEDDRGNPLVRWTFSFKDRAYDPSPISITVPSNSRRVAVRALKAQMDVVPEDREFYAKFLDFGDAAYRIYGNDGKWMDEFPATEEGKAAAEAALKEWNTPRKFSKEDLIERLDDYGVSLLLDGYGGPGEQPTRWAQYTTKKANGEKAGTDDREMLLQLPVIRGEKGNGSLESIEQRIEELASRAASIRQQHPIITERPEEVATELEDIRDEVNNLEQLRNELYNANRHALFREDVHYPNNPQTVVHVRANTREGPNGEKVLHIEEIQSDWAQQGRKYGFKGRSLAKGLKLVENKEPRWVVQVHERASLNSPFNEAAVETHYFPTEEAVNKFMDEHDTMKVVPGLYQKTEKMIIGYAKKQFARGDFTQQNRDAWVSDPFAWLDAFDAKDLGFDRREVIVDHDTKTIKVRPQVTYAPWQERPWQIINRKGEVVETFDSKEEALNSHYASINPAPFVTSTDAFVSLALKRAIRHAAENDFDMVTWTPGLVQNERYTGELRAEVKSIEWNTDAVINGPVVMDVLEAAVPPGSPSLAKFFMRRWAEAYRDASIDIAETGKSAYGRNPTLTSIGKRVAKKMMAANPSYSIDLVKYVDDVMPVVTAALEKRKAASKGTTFVNITRRSGGGLDVAIDGNGNVVKAPGFPIPDKMEEGQSASDLFGDSILEQILASPEGKLEGDNLTVGYEAFNSFYGDANQKVYDDAGNLVRDKGKNDTEWDRKPIVAANANKILARFGSGTVQPMQLKLDNRVETSDLRLAREFLYTPFDGRMMPKRQEDRTYTFPFHTGPYDNRSMISALDALKDLMYTAAANPELREKMEGRVKSLRGELRAWEAHPPRVNGDFLEEWIEDEYVPVTNIPTVGGEREARARAFTRHQNGMKIAAMAEEALENTEVPSDANSETVPGFVIDDKLRKTALEEGFPLYRQQSAAVAAEKMDDLGVNAAGIARRAKLSMMFLRHFANSVKDLLTVGEGDNKVSLVKQYVDNVFGMAATANDLLKESSKVAKRWEQLPKDTVTKLNELAAQATLSQIHPDLPLDMETHETADGRFISNRHHADGNGNYSDEVRQQHFEMQRAWSELGAQGQAVYKDARDLMARNWIKRGRLLNDVGRATYEPLIKKAEAEGDTKLARKLERDLRSYLIDVNAALPTLSGPYFPLERFGQYYVVKKGEGYTAAEAKLLAAKKSLADLIEELDMPQGEARKVAERVLKIDDDADIPLAKISATDKIRVTAARRAIREAQKALDKLAADPHEYSNEAFESEAQARRAAAAVGTKAREQKEMINDVYQLSKGMLDQLTQSVTAALPPDQADDATRALREIFLKAKPDTSATRSQIRRRNVSGFDKDMLRGFAAYTRRDAHYLSRLQHMDDITSTLQQMKAAASDIESDEVYNELARRHVATMEYKQTPVQDALTTTTFIWQLALSPSFWLLNASQPWMISLPFMSSRQGFGRTKDAMGKAFSDTTGLVKSSMSDQGTIFYEIDSKAMKDGKAILTDDERQMLDHMMRQGLLDITLEIDTGAIAQGKSTTSPFGRASRAVSVIPHQVEVFNRVMTALAAYRLEKGKQGVTKDNRQALDYTERVLDKTHLDYSAANAPYWLKPGVFPLSKVLFQYQKYNLGMVSLFASQLSQMFKGATAEERAEAKKALFGLTAVHGLMGGVVGLPFATTAFMLANLIHKAFGDDDEPWDAETAFRNWLADMMGKDAAAVASKGLPMLIGMDLSKRIGLGDLGLPFKMMRGDNKEGRDWYLELLASAAGPTIGGMGTRFFEGANLMADGNVQKGLEQFSPKLLADLSKMHRLSDEGLTTKKGLVALQPERLDAMDLALTALGLNPSIVSERGEAVGAVEKAKRQLADRRDELTRAYVEAREKGDSDRLIGIRNAVREYNEKRRIKGEPRLTEADLLQAYNQRRRVQKTMTEQGVMIPKNQKALGNYARFADVG